LISAVAYSAELSSAIYILKWHSQRAANAQSNQSPD